MQDNKNKLVQAVKDLIGLEYIESKWGDGTGSVLLLNFARSDYLNLPSALNQFEQPIKLMICCAWRIMTKEKAVLSWRDITIRDQALNYALDSLKQSKITKADYQSSTNDLNLYFSNGSSLSIFCDVTNNYESDDNYVLYSTSEILFVDFEGIVRTEAYKKH